MRQITPQAILFVGICKPDLDHVLDNLLQSNNTNARPNADNNQHQSRELTENSQFALSLMPDAYLSEISFRDTRATGESKNNANGGNYANKGELMMCKICLDADVGVTFVPCGHLVACVRCSQKLNKCPICRQYIQQKIKCYVT